MTYNVGDKVIMKNEIGKREGVVDLVAPEAKLLQIKFPSGGTKVTHQRNVKKLN